MLFIKQTVGEVLTSKNNQQLFILLVLRKHIIMVYEVQSLLPWNLG